MVVAVLWLRPLEMRILGYEILLWRVLILLDME